MWRSGAPQRREARGALRGADAPTRCYTQLRRQITSVKANTSNDTPTNQKIAKGVNSKEMLWLSRFLLRESFAYSGAVTVVCLLEISPKRKGLDEAEVGRQEAKSAG